MRNFSYIDLLAKYGIDGAHPGGLQLTRKILELEKVSENTALLDMGCGTGETSAYIAKSFGCEITAADINPAMLQRASQRFMGENLHIRLVKADAVNLPFRADSFDVVLAESVTVFTHIAGALKEYARVLKPGGILIDIELTAERRLAPFELRDVRAVLGTGQVPVQGEWCKMLRDAGFSGIGVSKGSANPPMVFFHPQMYIDFLPYILLMGKYGRTLGHRIYRCKK